MRWSCLCTVDRCVHYTYSICMKLDMLVSKNVVSTCKVLFVNLVLLWPAVSWGPTWSRISMCVWINCENDMYHFHILELLGEQGGVVWLQMAAHFVLSHCEDGSHKLRGGKTSQHILYSNIKGIRSTALVGKLSAYWSINICFQCIKCHKKCKTQMRSTELNCRSLPKSPSRSKMHRLSTSCFNAYISLGNLTGNPCFEPPSCHTRFDTLTWCCKHSFYLDSYLICSVANYMHVTNCYFLLSKAGFCFDILFIFLGVFFLPDFRFFYYFFSH